MLLTAAEPEIVPSREYLWRLFRLWWGSCNQVVNTGEVQHPPSIVPGVAVETFETPSMKNGICPKCQSSRSVGNLRATDRGEGNSRYDLSVAIYRNPEAWIFKGEHLHSLRAIICRDCGYTELYVADLVALNEDWDEIAGG